MDTLTDVMLDVRRLLALPGNDFSWSSFADQYSALRELDTHIESLRRGSTKTGGMSLLFAPTGPVQEVAISSGWGDEFVALGHRYDVACAVLHGHAVHICSVCSREAGRLQIEGDELRRTSFTSTLTQTATDEARAAIADAAALYRIDFELVPFYCPECEAVYCDAHWRREDVFEDGLHDSIRGTCPQGHERMLED